MASRSDAGHDDERRRAREAHSRAYRALTAYPHHHFRHSEGVREGRMVRPLSAEEERDPALVAEAVAFFEAVIDWANAGLRYAERRRRAEVVPQAAQRALEPRKAPESDTEGEEF